MKTPPDLTHLHLLKGQPKPTGEQVEWVLAHFADIWTEQGRSYGAVMQRMYGSPSPEKMIASGPGQCLANVLNCAREVPEVRKLYGECYT